MAPHDLTEVVAAAIHDSEGRMLLAQRADDGSAEAGLWEFPGGKLEPGETAEQALLRELAEELVVDAKAAVTIPGARCVDPQRRLAITLSKVRIEAQQPRCRVHQALRWLSPEQCIKLPLGGLDRNLAKWAAAPCSYHITPADGASMQPIAGNGRRAWILARWPGRVDQDELLAELIDRTESEPGCALPIMLHDRLDVPAHGRVVGSHLSSRVAAAFRERPLPLSQWLAISCHNQQELDHAARLQADFVVLGAVQPTASHPEREALGWSGLARLTGQAQLPVLALGGVGPADLAQARRCGASGVAGISAFWRPAG